MVLEAGKSKIRVPAELMSDEAPLPSLQMAAFLLFPHMTERVHVTSSFYKGTNPTMRAPSSWPNITLIISQRPHLQILLHWELMALTYVWGYGGHNHSFIPWSKVKSLSRVWLFVTPWTVAYKPPLSMEFPRQEYWSGLSFPSPGDLPGPGIEPRSPTLQADTLPSEPPVKPIQSIAYTKYI